MEKIITGEKIEYKQVLIDSPIYLMIEPTNRCNMKCKMCSREELTDIGDMSYDMFKKTLEMLPNIRTVKFQGLGEAYLAKDAVKMLELCKERSIDIVSITNCLWPAGIDIPYVMSLLNHLYISYHASDEKTYLEIVGTGNWKRLHENIEIIVRNKGKCDVVFNCVLSNINYLQAPKIVERAYSMGVEGVRFQIMQNWTTEKEELYDDLLGLQQVNQDKMIEVLKEAYDKGKKLGVAVSLVGNDEFDYTHCIWPFERVYINKNGDILPCHMRPNPMYSVGNIFDDSFDEVWNGEKYSIMRQLLRENKAPEMCIECPYITNSKELKEIRQGLKDI